jgi:sensor domain CHASE-containing protein
MQEAKKRVKLSHSSAVTTNLIRITIGVCILFLAVLILIHQNSTATSGYLFRTLERDRSALLREEELVKNELATEQSLKQLEQSATVQSMVKPQNVWYVNNNGQYE